MKRILIFLLTASAAFAQTKTLTVNGGTGAIAAPVNAATFRGANGIAPTASPSFSGTLTLGDLALSVATGLSIAGPEGLLTIDEPGGNVLILQNTNVAGYSALPCLSSNGYQWSTFGMGNPSSDADFAGFGYWEMWDSRTSAGAAENEFRFVQTSARSGDSYKAARMIIEKDLGSVYFNSFNGNGGARGDFTFDTDADRTTITVTNNVSSIVALRFPDDNFSMVGRDTALGGFSTTYYCFGGSGAGNGHNFFTGGVKASQTLKLRIADDAVAAGVPVRLKSYTVATLPAGAEGDTAYVTDATAPTYLGALTGGGAVKCPVFYNGSVWVSY